MPRDPTPEAAVRSGGVIISGGIVVTLQTPDDVLPVGQVVIEGDRIVAVSDGRLPVADSGSYEHIDASGCVVLPGLVDAHAHFRPLRAVGDGLGFLDWHDRYVHEFAKRMTIEDAYYGAAATFAEMLQNGITTVLGMSSISVVEPEELRAATDVGIRARLVPHAGSRADLDHTIDQAQRQGGSEDDRVRVWLGLEVPQLFDSDDLHATAEAADRLGVGIHTHFSEVEQDDLGPLVDSGLAGPALSLAHCVRVDGADIRLLERNRVAVAHNPKSNMRYGNGAAPVRAMLDEGVALGLGTDAPDSTFSCDLFEEMRAAALLARVTARDPGALSAEEALHLATVGGAAVLRMDESLGRLRAGAKADVIIVDLRAPHLVPHIAEGSHRNIVPLLVFAARGSDVRDVVVDGRVVVRDHVLLTGDEALLARECQERGARVLASM